MQTTELRPSVIAAAAALAVVAAFPSAASAQEPSRSDPGTSPDLAAAADSAALAAVRAFHDALAAGDSAGALALLHPEVRVFEGGHAETLSEYRSGHLAADMTFSAALERETLSESVSGRGDWRLYLSEYRMGGTFRGREVDAHGTETMVLVRTPDGWRIRHIHWSSR